MKENIERTKEEQHKQHTPWILRFVFNEWLFVLINVYLYYLIDSKTVSNKWVSSSSRHHFRFVLPHHVNWQCVCVCALNVQIFSSKPNNRNEVYLTSFTWAQWSKFIPMKTCETFKFSRDVFSSSDITLGCICAMRYLSETKKHKFQWNAWFLFIFFYFLFYLFWWGNWSIKWFLMWKKKNERLKLVFLAQFK